MTPAEDCLKLVEELPGSLVESLVLQLRKGAMPAMPNPGYQSRVDDFVGRWPEARGELAPMLEVALAAKRSAPTTGLVWTGPATAAVPGRRTPVRFTVRTQGFGRLGAPAMAFAVDSRTGAACSLIQSSNLLPQVIFHSPPSEAFDSHNHQRTALRLG